MEMNAIVSHKCIPTTGFQTARTLAVKFVTLYQLSSELLSKQVSSVRQAPMTALTIHTGFKPTSNSSTTTGACAPSSPCFASPECSKQVQQSGQVSICIYLSVSTQPSAGSLTSTRRRSSCARFGAFISFVS